MTRRRDVLVKLFSLLTLFLVTGHPGPPSALAGAGWSLVTDVEAAVAKGRSRNLQSGQSDESAAVSSDSNRRAQASVGTPFFDGRFVTARYELRSGLMVAAASGSLAHVIPPNELDLTSLIAKTEPFGVQIPPKTWQKDTSPVFIWEPPANGLNLAGYSYALDAEPDEKVETTATSWDVAQDPITRLPEGVHTFWVQAVNTAGNTGKSIGFEIWIDTTAPVVGGYSPQPGSLLKTLSPTFTAQVTEVSSGIDPSEVVLLVNGTPASVTVDQANGLLTGKGTGLVREGSNRVELQVPDRLGNVQPRVVWSFTVDVTPPTGTLLINGGASMTTSLHVTLNISASDAVSGVARMLISNDPVVGYVEEPFGSVRQLWRLNAVRGSQKVYVKLVDGVGNASQPISDEIELGLVSPETVIVSGPAGMTPEQAGKFNFSCPEGGCVFAYAFDHDDWSPWGEAATARQTNLALGNHYFKVKAAKEVNGIPGIQPDEEDPTPAERTWIVGVELPSILIPRGSPIKLWRLE